MDIAINYVCSHYARFIASILVFLKAPLARFARSPCLYMLVIFVPLLTNLVEFTVMFSGLGWREKSRKN